MARGTNKVGVGDPFLIDGKAYYSTPTSINTLDDKSLAEYKNMGRDIPTLTPEESDEFFRTLVKGTDQPHVVNAYRDLRLSKDQYQSYLGGQQVGTPDLIRADLGQTANPAGKTAAQGAPVYTGDPKAEAERKRNAATPALPPRTQTFNQPGQTPQAQTGAQISAQTYQVKPGSNLTVAAREMGISLQQLLEANPEYKANPNLVRAGALLKYPGQTPNAGQPGASGSDIQVQLSDAQAQMSALQKYGLDDTNKLTKDASGNYVPDTDNPDVLLSKYGLGNGQNTDIKDVIKQLSTEFGMPEVKAEVQKLDDQYADDVMEVNDNPWLSEGHRSKRISLLESKYETKKNALLERLKSGNETMKMAIDLYQSEKQLQQQKLLKAMDIKQKQLEEQSQQDFELYKLGLQQDKPIEVSPGASLYDPATGKSIYTAPTAKQIGGGTEGNGVDFTATEQKNYEAFQSEIPGYSNKEDALTDLQANKITIIQKIGKAGYDLLANDIENYFGSTPSKTTTTSKSYQKNNSVYDYFKPEFQSELTKFLFK